MSKIYPKDWVKPTKTGPLKINDKKKAEMVAWSTAYVVEPIEEKDLADALEQEYVSKGEHYTSSQLKEIVDQVKNDLKIEEDVVESPE